MIPSRRSLLITRDTDSGVDPVIPARSDRVSGSSSSVPAARATSPSDIALRFAAREFLERPVGIVRQTDARQRRQGDLGVLSGGAGLLPEAYHLDHGEGKGEA